MTIQPMQPIKQGRKSGSGVGGLLGLLGAGAAAVATGGMSIPATVGLLSGGASLGSTVGGIAKSGRPDSQNQGLQAPEDGAMTRRAKSGEAQAKLDQLKEAAMATVELPHEQRAEYLPQIMDAATILKQQQQLAPGGNG